MLTPITFTVSDEAGSRDVTVTAPDFVAYEAAYSQPVVKAIQDMSLTAYLFLIWHALERTGGKPGTFEEWLNTSPQFDAGEAKEPRPLDRKQRPGSSQPLPLNSE